MVDITFQPLSDGQYTTKRIISSLAANVEENDDNVEAGVLINTGAGNVVNKVLKIPPGLDALELQVRYHTANRSVKVRIFNSVDDLNYETTPTQEYDITDEKQIIKFDRWETSRFVKVQVEAFTANCTVSVKGRVQL